MIKRAFDLVVASLALVALMPLVAVVAMLVKVTSRGPVLFGQIRVGRGFERFRLVKFRTMHQDSRAAEADLARGARVTGIGKMLRRWKLDELPQLFNVLRGDMSLVGSRPELPHYVEAFRAEYSEILTVRPGVTDPASIEFCYEEALLAQAADPESLYRTVILPLKLELSRDYRMRDRGPAGPRRGWLRQRSSLLTVQAGGTSWAQTVAATRRASCRGRPWSRIGSTRLRRSSVAWHRPGRTGAREHRITDPK